MKPIYINGKFYAASLNGVHRVADLLIHELDDALTTMPEASRPKVYLLVPKNCRWPLDFRSISLIEQAASLGQIWEQFILPLKARDGLLVNLCNLAPVGHLNKVTMIHDAQFLFPDNSYPLRTRLIHKFLTPLIAHTSRTVLTVSEYSRQMLAVLKVSDSARTVVIPNGADHFTAVAPKLSIIERLNLVNRPFVVHIASTKSYKNTQVLLDAFQLPALRDVTLVAVGPDESVLRANGFNFSSNIAFTGKIDDAELRALYEAAICLALPSRTEGFGLPPAEAMTLGCPAVVAPAGAMPEVCGDAALYAGVDDPQGWADAIVQLHQDLPLRHQKIAAGRARMRAFTWAAAGRKLAQELMRLTGSGESSKV